MMAPTPQEASAQEQLDRLRQREKFIKFNLERSELWHTAQQQNILESPVLKTVFVDELPANVFMLKANASALPEYTSINPSKQQYYAMTKNAFYFLQKNYIWISLL
jgi:hypothetical protein